MVHAGSWQVFVYFFGNEYNLTFYVMNLCHRVLVFKFFETLLITDTAKGLLWNLKYLWILYFFTSYFRALLTWLTLSLYISSCLCSLKRPSMIISLSCPVLTLPASSTSLVLDFREYWCLLCDPWFSKNQKITENIHLNVTSKFDFLLVSWLTPTNPPEL